MIQLDGEVGRIGWIGDGGVGDVIGQGAIAGLEFILVVEVSGGNIDTGEALERGEEGGGDGGAEPRGKLVDLAAIVVLHLKISDGGYDDDDPNAQVDRERESRGNE